MILADLAMFVCDEAVCCLYCTMTGDTYAGLYGVSLTPYNNP